MFVNEQNHHFQTIFLLKLVPLLALPGKIEFYYSVKKSEGRIKQVSQENCYGKAKQVARDVASLAHYFYNRTVSTAILLLRTVYWTFLLCLLFHFPFFLYESKFCLFSLNFASLVFYSSEKVVDSDCIYLSTLNKQHESLFQLSVIAIFISLFITCYSHRLLLFEFNSKP